MSDPPRTFTTDDGVPVEVRELTHAEATAEAREAEVRTVVLNAVTPSISALMGLGPLQAPLIRAGLDEIRRVCDECEEALTIIGDMMGLDEHGLKP